MKSFASKDQVEQLRREGILPESFDTEKDKLTLTDLMDIAPLSIDVEGIDYNLSLYKNRESYSVGYYYPDFDFTRKDPIDAMIQLLLKVGSYGFIKTTKQNTTCTT